MRTGFAELPNIILQSFNNVVEWGVHVTGAAHLNRLLARPVNTDLTRKTVPDPERVKTEAGASIIYPFSIESGRAITLYRMLKAV